MNDITVNGDRCMTVREVAERLGCNPETIKGHIRELFPDLMRNGTTTYLTEVQVTVILEKMKRESGIGAGVNLQNQIVGIETALTPVLRLEMLYRQIDEIKTAEIERLKQQAAAVAVMVGPGSGGPGRTTSGSAGSVRDMVPVRQDHLRGPAGPGGMKDDGFKPGTWKIKQGAYSAGLSGMYSTISPGWQLRAAHILSIMSIETASPFPNRASVPLDMPAIVSRSVFFNPLLASRTNKGRYEIPMLDPP